MSGLLEMILLVKMLFKEGETVNLLVDFELTEEKAPLAAKLCTLSSQD